ncbi:MAG: hypothetical protein HWN67_00580 [Candidatus Helarchaeota archaeon]|nr:hypothetical protein [Candidatus Helarchaeota archaeon]
MEKKIKKKDKKKKKEKEGRIGGKTIILFVVFGISLLPFVLSPFENLIIQQNDYSIFNNGLKGTSAFYYRTISESGHIPLTITSSLNSLYILPSKNTILIELAPVQYFDPFEIMTLIDFIAGGGKLLLASNFGTGSELTLLNNLMSNFFVDPFKEVFYEMFLNITLTQEFNFSKILEDPLFSDIDKLTRFISDEVVQTSPKFSYWLDNNFYSGSIYEDDPSKSTIFFENLLFNGLPYGIIIDNIQAPYNQDVNEILLTQPTPLNLGINFGMIFEDKFAKEILEGVNITFYDVINDFLRDPPLNVSIIVNNSYDLNSAMLEIIRYYNISTTEVIAQTSSSCWVDTNANYYFDIMDMNGSFWISALSANKRVLLISQPQIFTNLFYLPHLSKKYDNSQFAMNLLNNLANNTPHFVVFDESKQQKTFPSFFSLFLRFINVSSGILLLIPVLPLLLYAMLSRWLPKIEKPKILKKSKIVKTKGESIFSERMKWYKRKRQYNRAISLLYRRLKRSIVKSIEIKSYDPNQTIEIIKKIKPHVNIFRMKRNLAKFERVDKKLMKITNQTTFLLVFNEMKWCYDQIK